MRRRFLTLALTLSAAWAVRAAPEAMPPAAAGRRRVVVVGGGWGGLSAARHLGEQAPELDVVLVEPNATFRSMPLAHRWLAGLAGDMRLEYELAAAARAYRYTHVRAAATAIDRERRRVVTTQGSIDYDWLVLAVGIRSDYSEWFGTEAAPAAHARERFPAAMNAGAELDALKHKLDGFAGGDLLMTIPPSPYRCPPAPYERAMTIAWMLKTRKIKGRLILIDPNAGMLGFQRVFAERYRDQVLHVTHARVTAVDPFRQVVSTEFDEFRFDDALLAPRQQAGELAWQAGLIGKDGAGQPSGWATVDPLHLHVPDDDRIFVVGDMIDRVSPLFGHYPKSGHLANRLGRIVAGEIAARARGHVPEPVLPDSVCYVLSDLEPMEMTRIDAQYRLRGDGLVTQSVRQHVDPQPRGEDMQWASEMFREFLAV